MNSHGRQLRDFLKASSLDTINAVWVVCLQLGGYDCVNQILIHNKLAFLNNLVDKRVLFLSDFLFWIGSPFERIWNGLRILEECFAAPFVFYKLLEKSQTEDLFIAIRRWSNLHEEWNSVINLSEIVREVGRSHDIWKCKLSNVGHSLLDFNIQFLLQKLSHGDQPGFSLIIIGGFWYS